MTEPLPEKNQQGGEAQGLPPESFAALKLEERPEQEGLASFKQSLSLFGRAVTRYKYFVLGSALLVTFLVYLHCKLQTPIYFAQAKVLVEPQTRVGAEEIVGLRGETWWPEIDLYTQQDVMQSRVVAEKVIEKLGLRTLPPFHKSGDPIGQLVGLIKVKASSKSQTLEVGTYLPDPVLATRITNEVINAYIDVSDEKERQWIDKTLSQMRNEITGIKDRVAEDQERVKRYEVEHPKVVTKVALDGQLENLNKELVAVSGEKLRLRTELEELVSFQKQGQDVQDHPRISKAPSVESILGVIQQKEVEMTQLLKIYKERFPIVAEKRAELAQLEEILVEQKERVLEDLKSQYLLLAAREHELRNAIALKSKELSGLLEEFTGYQALLGEVEISKNLYSLMLERMDKAAILGRSASVKVKVLNPAIVPTSPALPQTGRAVMSASIGSLLAMSYFVYLFFLMFKPIESEEEIAQGTRIPVLAQIPRLVFDEKEEKELLLDQEEGFGKDALHVLRASLLAGNHRNLLFTSALPAEGKTFVVRNLGVFLAREGWRVLMVATDFRDPRLKSLMGMEVDGRSIEAYMEGKCTEQEIIHSCQEPRLFFMGSEKALENSLEVITSPRFQKLLQEVMGQFDFTLLDSPPLQLFPDGELLAQKVRDVIFVVRAGKTPLQTLSKAIGKIEKNGHIVTGSILNFKSLEWPNYYYYNYYYGKGGRKGGRQRLVQQVVHEAKRYATGVRQFVEKRLHIRFKAALPVELTHTTPKGEKHTFWGIITDISEGGVLVEYQEGRYPKGIDPSEFKLLELKIKLSGQEAISSKGTVVRVNRTHEEVRLGIEFSEISEEDRNKIKRFFKSRPLLGSLNLGKGGGTKIGPPRQFMGN